MSQSDRTVMTLPIASIGELPPSHYVGLIDAAAVACLTVRLAAEGLLSPIWVRRNGNAAKAPWSVVAGRHRLLAASKLGWTTIDVVQRADANSGAEELRRLQVSENLDRRTLRPIELACNVMERWRQTSEGIEPSAACSQQSAAVRDRWANWQHASNTPVGDRGAIDAATGAACGRSDKWARTYRRIFESIVSGLPEHFARLNAHPLGESLSAMNKLVTLNEVARRQAADMILKRDDWASIDEALVAANVAASRGNRPEADAHDRLIASHWSRMSEPQRHGFALHLAKHVSPSTAQEMVELFRASGLL